MTGKIVKGIAGFYYVNDGLGGLYECKAKGIFRNRKIKPLVGDNVEFAVLDAAAKEGNIMEIHPRANALVRPAAANIDQALVIFSVSSPSPNMNLLDRFLVMMEFAQIPVMICFNKVDLMEEEETDRLRRIYEPAGYPVYFTSTCDDVGLNEIRNLIKGKTTVLAGPSGVGKSSLMNLIQPDANMETGIISEKIKRGKHTTRHSELFYVEENTYMMDTPGFSSMFIEDMEAGELKNYFPEFLSFEAGCRFIGCVHVGEKVCGVKEAVLEGVIDRSRYDNYLLMYQELKDKKRY